MSIDQQKRDKRSIYRKIRDFRIIHGAETRNIAIVVAGCLAVSAFLFEPRSKVGYERAIIEDFGVREGSKTPGVRLWVRTGDGKRRLINSRAFMPGLQSGDEICLLRTQGKLRKRIYLQPALPSRCLGRANPDQEI